MDDFRVSVIMPAYRCAGTIGRAIDSIMAQTRRPDEIIVVDDGSPDDVASAIACYGDAIQLIHKTNGGASSARNAGIDAATGNVIAFLDADDLWHPRKLERQLDILERYPEVGLVASRYLIRLTAGITVDYPALGLGVFDKPLRPVGRKVFDLSLLIWTSAVTVRTSVLGSDRFDENLKIAEDRDLWIRLVRRSHTYLISRTDSTLIERPGSLSRSDLDLDCQSMLTMIRKHTDLLGPRGVRKWEASVYRRWAGTYLGCGRSDRAIRPAVRRLTYQPFSPEGWWVLLKSSIYALAGVKTVSPLAKAQEVTD